MTSATFSTSTEAQQAAVLLESYRFELANHDARQWVSLWLEFYRPSWIRDAVVEALYQGRYKSVSVRQILELWQRRGQPIRHVTHEFEAAVCREFGEVKVAPTTSALPVQHRSIRIKEDRNPHDNLNNGPMNGQMNGHTNGQIDSIQSIKTTRRARNAAVSFDLSPALPVSPGMAVGFSAAESHDDSTQTTASAAAPIAAPTAAPTVTARETTAALGLDEKLSRHKVLDNKAWRDFPTYTTPLYELQDDSSQSTSRREEMLQTQRKFNGVLYTSAKAIQPFKPALPFSAHTLRRAKQKALELMAESH